MATNPLIIYANELYQIALDRRTEAAKLLAIVRANEVEADRIEAKAHEIMAEAKRSL